MRIVFATPLRELLLAGVPLERVSILLGHNSIKVTEKRTHHGCANGRNRLRLTLDDLVTRSDRFSKGRGRDECLGPKRFRLPLRPTPEPPRVYDHGPHSRVNCTARSRIPQANARPSIPLDVTHSESGLTFMLTRDETNWFLEQIDAQNFSIRKSIEEDRGVDGAEWIIEGVRSKTYHVVDRWFPNDGSVRAGAVHGE